MKLKLFLLMLLTATFPLLAQQATVKGTVVDAKTGKPVAGAAVMLNDQGLVVTTGPSGDFSISNVAAGSDVIIIAAYGYDDLTQPVAVSANSAFDLGVLKIGSASNLANAFNEQRQEILFDQNAVEDEEGNDQSVGVLAGASDNVYYDATNYSFSTMRFRTRGYDSYLSTTYINGIPFNDLARGRFNHSTLGGMNRMFRNRTNTMGMGASDYGFGGIGGSSNINTITEQMQPICSAPWLFTQQASTRMVGVCQ